MQERMNFLAAFYLTKNNIFLFNLLVGLRFIATFFQDKHIFLSPNNAHSLVQVPACAHVLAKDVMNETYSSSLRNG